VEATPAHGVANFDLLRLIPEGTARVVEPGCSGGALAREYRRLHPDCEYVGIEADLRYADIARAHCSRVLVADVERLEAAELATLAPAGCWVFGDVLEHLRDPWGLLARIRPHATHVVACIPNMQHWSVIQRLVAGDLFYEDEGLLDRTHLRWFTRATLTTMFTRAGYRVVTLRGRVFEQEGRAEALGALRNYAAALSLDPAVAVRDADVMQWLLLAEAQSPPQSQPA
jgi:hypothetical protein